MLSAISCDGQSDGRGGGLRLPVECPADAAPARMQIVGICVTQAVRAGIVVPSSGVEAVQRRRHAGRVGQCVSPRNAQQILVKAVGDLVLGAVAEGIVSRLTTQHGYWCGVIMLIVRR